MLDDLAAWWHAAVGVAESAPPLELFIAMTLLPLVGVPVSPFWVASGIRLGPPLAMLAATASLLLNAAIGYWLAHSALRLPLSRWVARHGYAVPQVPGKAETRFIIMIRVAPPLPLFIQNYLLGLAGVRFIRYLALSILVQAAYAFGFIWFGNALTEHELWKIALGLGVLIAIMLGMSIVRAAMQARLRDDGASF